MSEPTDCCAGSEDSGRFDLAVVGGGSAAFAAVLRASELGARTLLVNEGTIGGTCVNIGCVPSKTLIRAAENAHAGGLSRFRGIRAQRGGVDFSELIREKDELVESLRRAKYTDVLDRLTGIQFVAGRAKLRGDRSIQVGSTIYEAERVVIATGSRPSLPNIPGLAEAGVWDSTRALAASELPRHLIVLGGGYVALELGQMFARLGSQITLVQRSDQILRGEDPDVAERLTGFLRDEGIDVRAGHQVERVERTVDGCRVSVRHDNRTELMEGSAVIAALGREPNTEGLGEVQLDERRFVKVGQDLETTVPGIYAAGDVIGDPAYVYAAAYEGGLAAENALRGTGSVRDYTAIPWVIFTDPQVSGVGLNEGQAAAAGVEVDVSVVPLDQVPRALAARDTRGFIKLLRARGEDRLVGARILAQEGGEQIMEASLMIRFGLPISEVSHHFHPYLTQGEGVKLGLLGFDKDVGSLSCCAH